VLYCSGDGEKEEVFLTVELDILDNRVRIRLSGFHSLVVVIKDIRFSSLMAKIGRC